MNEEQIMIRILLQNALRKLRYPQAKLSAHLLNQSFCFPQQLADIRSPDWPGFPEMSEEQKTYMNRLLNDQNTLGFAERATEQAVRCKIIVVSPGDGLYPFETAELPPFIYLRGPMKLPQAGFCVSVIGTRSPSPYGVKATRYFVGRWANWGLTLVSGMASGIDGLVHETCLKEGGNTAAVLGCGPDICYPDKNRNIYRKLCECGLLISEYPPLTPPAKQNFPARNRLISALSDSLVVIEAARSSGTMITTDFALDQGKAVLALPGSIYSPVSQGTNHLLREGAIPIIEPNDLLPFVNRHGQIFLDGDNTQDAQIGLFPGLLRSGPLTVPELKLLSKLPEEGFYEQLLASEMKGEIRKSGGRYHLI